MCSCSHLLCSYLYSCAWERGNYSLVQRSFFRSVQLYCAALSVFVHGFSSLLCCAIYSFVQRTIFSCVEFSSLVQRSLFSCYFGVNCNIYCASLSIFVRGFQSLVQRSLFSCVLLLFLKFYNAALSIFVLGFQSLVQCNLLFRAAHFVFNRVVLISCAAIFTLVCFSVGITLLCSAHFLGACNSIVQRSPFLCRGL